MSCLLWSYHWISVTGLVSLIITQKYTTQFWLFIIGAMNYNQNIWLYTVPVYMLERNGMMYSGLIKAYI